MNATDLAVMKFWAGWFVYVRGEIVRDSAGIAPKVFKTQNTALRAGVRVRDQGAK